MQHQYHNQIGVYTYLESLGVFQHGTNQEIAEAKKNYWKKIKNEWKKNKRKVCKSFTVLYSQDEYKILRRQALQTQTSITNYIKRKSLSSSNIIFDKKAIGQFRESIFEHYNAIQTVAEEEKISEQLRNIFTKQIEHIERLLMKIIPS